MIRDIKRFFFNIKRLIQWTKVLWGNYDWDYEYLLKIISFKLKLMEKHFREDGVTVSAEKHANEMKSMIEICDRLIADDYAEIPYGRNYKLLENRTELAYAIKLDTNEILTEKEFKDLAELSEANHNQDIESLSKGLLNIRRWWD